ncbi:alanine racemase [Lutimonas saemankumensis]|uniref:alanine racemase n=1 Tax=Lutimonas saemankumensis TaxID=483016 RepID=UPI001CD6FC92|nr:alanine racemase [Lutimonas saemankumensis]MCA0932906.1 alanine racemase [Lutimonas saemankumensis]
MNNSPTVLEIDLSSIEHNLNFFRSQLNPKTKILAVVKASGYGSDSVIMAETLEKLEVDYFAVAYADEGIALRSSGISTPILVLHPQLQNLEIICQNNLEPNLYSRRMLSEFLKLAKSLRLNNYPVHIKFNTGLNRLGFDAADIDFVCDNLKEQSLVRVKSIFSHLVASEDEGEKEFSLDQIEKFKSICSSFNSRLGYTPIRHMSNTSGILNYPETHFDMIRVGLGLYGFTNLTEKDSNLKNVLTLKTVISQIHSIKTGESVGYNRGFHAKSNMKTATLPIGHADGFFRSLGNGKTYVSVKGKKSQVIGNVCMDMIMIDVTDIPCKEGDEVIIFNSREEILLMADHSNSISYEILTAWGNRIRRVLK